MSAIRGLHYKFKNLFLIKQRNREFNEFKEVKEFRRDSLNSLSSLQFDSDNRTKSPLSKGDLEGLYI